MDLMASYPTVKKDLHGHNFKFYSQYFEKQAKGTDVFAQNIPKSCSDTKPEFCFPPFALIPCFYNLSCNPKAGGTSTLLVTFRDYGKIVNIAAL